MKFRLFLYSKSKEKHKMPESLNIVVVSEVLLIYIKDSA